MTFREILEKLKINAKKVLRGKAPEDSLPVVSKDYNDLIDALKELETGGFTPLWVVQDPDPATSIILSDAEGNLNTLVQVGEDLIISGDGTEGSKYRILAKMLFSYNQGGLLEPVGSQTVSFYAQIFKNGAEDPIQVCADSVQIQDPLPKGIFEYAFIFDFISLYNLTDGDFVRLFVSLNTTELEDISTQTIEISYSSTYFSFYVEKTNLISELSITLP